MIDILLIIAGGGLGSACRYLLTTVTGRFIGDSFAWGTLAVNLIGCFLIGLALGLADRSLVSREFRLLAVTGFLGGFTTFSTFSFESIQMLLYGATGKGLANIGINVAGGLVLSVSGLYLASRN